MSLLPALGIRPRYRTHSVLAIFALTEGSVPEQRPREKRQAEASSDGLQNGTGVVYRQVQLGAIRLAPCEGSSLTGSVANPMSDHIRYRRWTACASNQSR